jgi:DNA-binding NtrC family response regulator
MSDVLIVEENRSWRTFLSKALSSFHKLTYWPNDKDISEKLTQENSDVIILDLQIQEKDALALLNRLNSTIPNTPVIVTSETEETELVVKAVKHGAFDFVSKTSYTVSTKSLHIARL